MAGHVYDPGSGGVDPGLTGKVALVTAASEGIGKGIAEGLAKSISKP